MAPSRFPRSSAVLITATLAATSSAIDFGSGGNDATQTAGSVAPGGGIPPSTAGSGANGFGNFDSPTQWSASSSNNVPTNAPVAASSGSGGWSQPLDTPTVWSGGSGQSSGSGQGWTPPTSTDSSSMLPPTSGQSNGSGQGWTPPISTDSPVLTPTSGQSSGNGDQGWSQPMSTDSSSGWTPSSGQGSGTGDQGWTSTASSAAWTSSSGESSGYDDQTLTVDCSGSNGGGWSPGGGEMSLGSDDDPTPGNDFSLECSGSDDEFNPGNDFSLECSGSDEETPSVSTSTTGSSNFAPMPTTAPTTSSGTDEQPPPSSMASSAATAASGEYEDPSSTQSSSNAATSTTSSGTTDQGWSQATQTSTASSSNTESSSNTAQSMASSSNTATSTASSSNTPTHEGSEVAPTSHSAAATAANSTVHATFGAITSGSDKCIIGNPETYISAKDLEWIWENRMKAEVTAYDNWILDHLVANKGSINYCVRWDSDKKLDKEIASKFQDMLSRQHAAWNHWLVGYNCWPHDEIKVNVVGFAVKDKSLLGWSDDSLGTIYAGDLDKDGSPQCPTKCYRSYNDGATDGWSESSGCTGEPFDISLWPKQGLGGGWGTYWGQQVNLDNMLEHLDDQELEIVSHEMGHGFGLPDFYQEPKPANFKPCLMDGLTSSYVRDTDGWMLRRVLESKKANYNF